MRTLVVVMLGALACRGSRTEEAPAPAPATAVAPDPAPGSGARALALDHVTLLQPEAVVGERSDADSLAGALKQISATIIAHDRGLPDELDAFVAARPGATRVWLTSATGDLAAAELDKELAKLAPLTVRSGTIALVMRLVRAGSTPSKQGPFMPGPWKAAAGADGGAIDAVIDRAWPH